MLWKVRNHTFNLSQRPLLMGVLNVTPDSFSDGGFWTESQQAIRAGFEMIRQGADLIDIGGESSRPGAEPVSVDEELKRVLPVVEALAGNGNALLSIDTCKPEVALVALRAGANVVNDITGLREAAMRTVVRECGAGAIAMHMRGTPATMQDAPVYADVVAEVLEYLRASLLACERDGIAPEQILLDPGIGFGKTCEHNLSLLAHLPELEQAGRPLALGVSRKSFLGNVIGSGALTERLWPTTALTSYACSKGVALVRVHDVAANMQVLGATQTILEACA
jgi:dihydropteroate synthase